MIHNITYTPTHRITCMYIAGSSVIASIYQVYKYQYPEKPAEPGVC